MSKANNVPFQRRWRLGSVLVPLLVGSLLACQEPSTPGESSAVEEDAETKTGVRETLESYYKAFSARDWPRFENHFWEGATMTTIWVPEGETEKRVVATSIPDFVARAPSGPGSREIFQERIVSADIAVEGDLALARVRYHARFGDPGDIMDWEGMDVFTLIRFGGEWRISSLAFLPDSD